MTIEELEILLERYYKGACNEEEFALVSTLLDTYAIGNNLHFDEDERQEVLKRIQRQIETQSDRALNPPSVHSKTAPLHRLLKLKWWAAAAMVLLCLGLYHYLQSDDNLKVGKQVAISMPVHPGTTSASLLLSDGKLIPLDSSLANKVKNIQIVNGVLSLIKKDGQRIDLDRTAGLKVYSTLVTRRGQQAPKMTLGDGTVVWLNAASSLRFPVAFNGQTREVELSGEAYFEVAKDAAHPFIVKTQRGRIQVLGTHFNVMAYKDEPNLYATLLEGSIQMDNGAHQSLLTPGHQGIIDEKGAIKVYKVDPTQAVAWLNGKLPMNRMEVHAFLREVSRWYDVDIEYKQDIESQTFSGNLNRNVPLVNILRALQANGIQCILQGRTIIVSK